MKPKKPFGCSDNAVLIVQSILHCGQNDCYKWTSWSAIELKRIIMLKDLSAKPMSKQCF